MKTATVKEIKYELGTRSTNELIELCLNLSKFKKENKELLTYLLYESSDEASYIESIKEEIELQFEEINTSSYYFIKKSTRKILRSTKKYIRYSKNKETEASLLLHFCRTLLTVKPSIQDNNVLLSIYDRQIASIKRIISGLHEDLQYDYTTELNNL